MKVADHLVELRCQSSPVAYRQRSRGFDFVHNLLHMTGEKVLQPFVDSQRQLVALFNGDSTAELGGVGFLMFFGTDLTGLIQALDCHDPSRPS